MRRISHVARPRSFPQQVLSLTTHMLAQNNYETSPSPILRESGVEGLSTEPTFDKPLSLHGPGPLSAQLSVPTKVDDAYLHWRKGIYLSHICCAPMKRRLMVVLEKHPVCILPRSVLSQRLIFASSSTCNPHRSINNTIVQVRSLARFRRSTSKHC